MKRLEPEARLQFSRINKTEKVKIIQSQIKGNLTQ